MNYEFEQAGTGPSWRHIQGSKIAKRLPSVKYYLLQYSKIENFSKTKWTEWRAWCGKVSQCRKTERGDPLRFFNNHSVAKHEKFEGNKNFYFRKKSHSAEKTERGDPLGFSNIQSVAKQQKNWKGGPFGLPGDGMVRGKTGKTFLVQFARPNSAMWCNNIL